jgi:ABC-type nickel/cobalt efflux system permease component RcnA
MANYNVDNKKINKALATGFGITAVILLVVFGLIYIVTSFAGSTTIPVFIIVGFIVIVLGGTLYWWYRRAQKQS